MSARFVLPSLLLLFVVAGCAESRDPADISIKSHPTEWSKSEHPEFHGSRVARDTAEGCPTCHGSDYRGEGRASSCYECHDGPSGHPERWVSPGSPNFHGDEAASDGVERCRACHGEELDGGWSEVSCTNACHAGPGGHPEGWVSPTSPNFHGTAVAEEGTERCTACHGDDLQGGWSGISCYNQCHANPSGHPNGWVDDESPNFHGTEVASDGVERCRACHGEDLDGGTSGVSCSNSCHANPGGHPPNWVNPTNHGEDVAQNGTDRCKACHGDDLLGGWSEVSCTNACHSGPGGHKAEWLTPGSPDFHGTEVASDGLNECKRCHGDDLLGGTSGISCTNACHDGPGGHPAGWVMRGQPFHGTEVAQDGSERCTACHGADLRGGWSEVSCYNVCHATPSGHPPNWLSSASPNFHGAVVADDGLDGCRPCHGADLDGGSSGVSCTNACHDGPGGHPMGWLDDQSANFHGTYVVANTNESCGTCHGTDFRGGWSGVSCYSACHDGPGGHPDGWLTEGSGRFHGNYVIENDADDCMPCHGVDLRGGWSGVNCYNVCHDWSASDGRPGGR